MEAFHLDSALANTILEALPDAVVLIDEAKRIVFANPRVEAMFGHARGELLGGSIEVLIPRGLGEEHRQRRFGRRKDGSELPVEMSVGPVRASRGALLAVVIRDVSASDFRALFHEMPEGIFLSDRDHVWTDANPAACRMLGYSREELVGKRVDDLITPEGATRVAEARERLLAAPDGGVTVEHTFSRKDGTSVPVEVTAKYFPDGRCYAFARDVSERKRAERECDESLRWMRAVLEQSPLGLALVHGPRFEQLEFNARAEQLLGRPWDKHGELQERLHAPDGQPADPEQLPLVEALRGKRTVRAEFLARNAAGDLTPIAINAGPIVGPDGAVLGAVAGFEDITARKELERLRAEWSSVVAHDLRQPLSAISGIAQLLARKSDHPVVLKYAEQIHAAATRLGRMVGDLLDLSRLEASRLELVRRRVDVPSILHGYIEQAALQAPDRHFDVRVQGEVPDAYADPDRVAQVLENLLTNAVKYGRPGSRIVATVARERGEVAVSVVNEGRALSAEEIQRMFQRFHRTRSARLEGIQGVGLGLYITRSLVEAHGGRIAAESTPDGVTTFRFTLPLAD